MEQSQMVDYLIMKGREWVQEQRRVQRPDAASLDEGAKSAFRPFFDNEVLDSVRFRTVPSIPNPGFYRDLEAMGQPIPIDFATMAGITFIDTVLLSKPLPQPVAPSALMFHELVHVVQYLHLGVAEFMTRYVRGWADNGFEYVKIPLERDAYELQARYEHNPDRVFSVRDAVARQQGGAPG